MILFLYKHAQVDLRAGQHAVHHQIRVQSDLRIRIPFSQRHIAFSQHLLKINRLHGLIFQKMIRLLQTPFDSRAVNALRLVCGRNK